MALTTRSSEPGFAGSHIPVMGFPMSLLVFMFSGCSRPVAELGRYGTCALTASAIFRMCSRVSPAMNTRSSRWSASSRHSIHSICPPVDFERTSRSGWPWMVLPISYSILAGIIRRPRCVHLGCLSRASWLPVVGSAAISPLGRVCGRCHRSISDNFITHYYNTVNNSF